MAKHSDNIWAQEMDIDLDVLRTEAFTHHSQIMLHNKLHKQAEEYWAWVAHKAGSQRVEQLIDEAKSPGQQRALKKNRQRRDRARKLREYVFTKTQIQIADRSINAQGSV